MPVYEYKASSNKLNLVAGGTFYADLSIGSIIPYGGTTTPSGWLLCQGQAVSRTTYADLFTAIGTAFGEGDGSTTFNVPDLRETVPVGSGSRNSDVTSHDIYTVGQFKDDQLQGHWHGGKTWVNTAGWVDGSGHLKTTANGGTDPSSNGYSSDGHGEPRVGDTTHGKQLGVNYIIKAKHVAMPTDFMDAIDSALSEFAKPISLQSVNNSTINFDKSRVVGGLVTVCADIIVQSGSYLVKENAIANVPNYGTSAIGYILPCIYRNTANGAEEPGYVLVNPGGNILPYYTKSEYNQVRVNASYSSYQ